MNILARRKQQKKAVGVGAFSGTRPIVPAHLPPSKASTSGKPTGKGKSGKSSKRHK